MSSENKMTMTRIIVGVASVGATLALVYLYNKYQERRSKSASGTTGKTGTASGSRMRRQSAKSGEVKKVTFKTSSGDEEDEEEGEGAKSVTDSSSLNCKSLSQQELVKRNSSVLKATPHANETEMKCMKDGPSNQNQSSSVSSSSAHFKTALDDDDPGPSSHDRPTTTTNSYENNSTLKLEDSTINNSTTTITSDPSVVTTPAPAAVEVITRSKGGPLMTSTPLPGKDSSSGHGHVPLRAAAAVFEPHSSDLHYSSAQVDLPVSAQDVDYDAHQFRSEMRIPRDIVAGLIGKKGSNIKRIQAQSNTTINFQDETLENGDRVCVIRGAPQNVPIAEALIEKHMMEQPLIYTETVTVPLSAVGRIIGRGGETIRSIQDLSKARVNVESHNHYGGDSGPPTRSITIKGSEEQIRDAKKLIIEKVEEERNLRKTIDSTTASRTYRRGGGGTSPSSHNAPGTSGGSPSTSNTADPALPLKKDGILEVFVSCVYHPNDFWIQVVGRDAIELDKLCENMTDYYAGRQNGNSETEFQVGDIVAAPFEVDGKVYRAKIVKMDDNGVEVSYLDYGDRRVLPITEIYKLEDKFLNLRFQAIQATLNLGCIGDKWEDDVINEFCDLTYCAQWQSLTAKVKSYLKDIEDGHDVICIELLDKDVNIGEELIRKGLATPKGPSGCNGAQGIQKKSYAAAALGISSNSTPSGPVISSADPTVQESMENERNGN